MTDLPHSSVPDLFQAGLKGQRLGNILAREYVTAHCPQEANEDSDGYDLLALDQNHPF